MTQAGSLAVFDPCTCAAVCQHGERCMAGHSDPDAHSFYCETCSPPTGHGYLLADGRHILVVAGCGHALGPDASFAKLTRAVPEHIRGCKVAARRRSQGD